MYIDLILLILLVGFSLLSVMNSSLIKAAISLACTSIILTIIMFKLASPLAAVFELSVCAGLITVVFMSTISMTLPRNKKERIAAARERIKKYIFLPVIAIISGVILFFVKLPSMPGNLIPAQYTDVREVLWLGRNIDMLGQIVVILAGIFGIVVLFKNKITKK